VQPEITDRYNPAITENGNAWSNSITAKTLSVLKQKLALDAPLYALVLAYWVAGYAYLTFTGRVEVSNFLIYFQLLFPLIGFSFPVFLIIYSIIVTSLRLKRRRILGFRLMMRPENLARIISVILLLASVCIFMGMFTSVKTSFAALQGFKHDVWQADLDKLLFFGNEPWRILFEPFHTAFLQMVIEVNYNMVWHIQTYAILFLACISSSQRSLRARYFTCFILVWAVVGNLFAGMFISAGPAFYGAVTGDELRFGEQMQMLAAYPENTVTLFQNFLWNAYETNSTAFGTGISAFPSVHVSIAALNVFFAFEYGRKTGLVALAYALFILYSSVYLAWHYAIDGIFGAMLVAVIYYGTKRLIGSDTQRV